MFGITWVFVRNQERSKEYRFLGRCVSAGLALVQGAGRQYALSTDGGATLSRKYNSIADIKPRVKSIIARYPNKRVLVVALDEGVRVDKVKFFTLDSRPPEVDTQGVEGIDRIVGWIESEVKQGRLKSRRYAGICVCKTTTSGAHSDHADCAAIDIFATAEDMERIRDVVIAEAEYFYTKYAILWDRIWFPDEDRHYPGDYHWHDHISVNGGVYNSAC